ncbi:MAG TPA: hypothetical protein VG206_14990 [Terriglobia bacterium]|nr:hypothetical protein [Terriglobia bacterium]
MQNVLCYIEKRTTELNINPFITWLSDPSIPAKERLSRWLPCAAFFVFGFKDLNGEALQYPKGQALRDPLKWAINQHAAEDSMHWPWYLNDLRTLGLDVPTTLSEALQFLWGDETLAQRRAVYRLCTLADRAQDPLLRYSMIAALESYAHLLFATVTRASEEFERETGIGLEYLGAMHFGREPGHLANQEDNTEAMLLPTNPGDKRWVARAASSTPTGTPAGSVPVHKPAGIPCESSLSAPGSIPESADSCGLTVGPR